MLDHPQAGADAAFISPHNFTIGDIIAWPFVAPTGVALVIEVESFRGWQVLTVAPGAPDRNEPVRRPALRVVRSDEVRGSGLPGPVRFDLASRISVSPSHPSIAAIPSPVIGRLCDSAMVRLHEKRARIHAQRDIAAWRREERRESRRGDTRTGWRRAPRAVATAEREVL